MLQIVDLSLDFGHLFTLLSLCTAERCAICRDPPIQLFNGSFESLLLNVAGGTLEFLQQGLEPLLALLLLLFEALQLSLKPRCFLIKPRLGFTLHAFKVVRQLRQLRSDIACGKCRGHKLRDGSP